MCSIGAVQAGVGAFANDDRALGIGVTSWSGLAGMALVRLGENGMSGNGASSARARNRRRATAMRTPTTTITMIVVTAAIRSVW